MHAVAFGYLLITSIVGAVLGVYLESELGAACWVDVCGENTGIKNAQALKSLGFSRVSGFSVHCSPL